MSVPSTRALLYLTPYPPTPNGIADYAFHFKGAVEEFTEWRLEVASSLSAAQVDSLQGLGRLRRQVAGWLAEGTLRPETLVHAEIGTKQQAQFYTLFWLRRMAPRIRYCITVHDPPLTLAPALSPLACGLRLRTVRQGLRVLDYSPLGRGVVHSVLHGASALFVLSATGTEEVRKRIPGHRRLETLPLINYYRAPPVGPPRDPEAPVRVLFLGFWARGKGIETLLDAVELVAAPGECPMSLVMAGGPEPTPVSQRYAEGVLARIRQSPARHVIQVVGYLPEPELDAALGSADILAIPYTHAVGYSASSVLVRAMSAGLPVVASAIGSLKESVRDEETGLTVPSADAPALARALRRLIEDAEARRRMGARAREIAFTLHARRTVAEQAASVYCAVADEFRRQG